MQSTPATVINESSSSAHDRRLPDSSGSKRAVKNPMSEKQKECIREKLANLRHDAGLTQSEVAAEIGVSRQVYNRYERGLQYIPMSRLEIIADFYGVTTEYLLDE